MKKTARGQSFFVEIRIVERDCLRRRVPNAVLPLPKRLPDLPV
jgi:hypothetical protein